MYSTNNFQTVNRDYVMPILDVIELHIEDGFVTSSQNGGNEGYSIDNPEQDPF